MWKMAFLPNGIKVMLVLSMQFNEFSRPSGFDGGKDIF